MHLKIEIALTFQTLFRHHRTCNLLQHSTPIQFLYLIVMNMHKVIANLYST